MIDNGWTQKIAELEQEVENWAAKYNTAAGQLANIKADTDELMRLTARVDALAIKIQGEASGR